MREIKFRAFKKKMPGRGMYKVEGIDFKKKSVQLQHSFGSSFWVPFRGIERMQFTGLHDKNGKEIYEGDIVKDNLDYIRAVVFHPNGYFALKRDRKTGVSYADLSGVDGIVIGNICENPELLKGV